MNKNQYISIELAFITKFRIFESYLTFYPNSHLKENQELV